MNKNIKILKENNKNFVLIPVDEYNEMIDTFHDFSVVKSRLLDKNVSIEELKKNYV